MKTLNQGDFTRTDIIANKQFTLSETSSLLVYGTGEQQVGTFSTESTAQSNGFYKGPLYGSIKTQFYLSDYRPQTTQSLHPTASIIQLSQRVFDEKVKENSVTLVSNSDTFYDDGNGNLYLSGSQLTKIGNVFYEHGAIVITDTGSYATAGSGSFELTFRSTHTKTQLNFSSTVQPTEFNYSSNPTAVINGKTTFERPRYSYELSNVTASYGETITSQSIIPEFLGIYPTQVSSSIVSGGIDQNTRRLTPYITTIGYYDDIGQLLAITKLASPTPVPDDFPITFRSRIDI